MAKTDDIFINTFKKAFDEGEFIVTCRDASTAQHLRFRAYNFARQVKKDGERHGALASIAGMVGAVSISLKGEVLTFIRKDREAAMADLLGALGEGGDTPYIDPMILASAQRAAQLAESPTTPEANVDTMKPSSADRRKTPSVSQMNRAVMGEEPSQRAAKYLGQTKRKEDPPKKMTLAEAAEYRVERNAADSPEDIEAMNAAFAGGLRGTRKD